MTASGRAPEDAPDAARGVLVVGDVMTDVIVKPNGPLVRGGDRAATIRTVPGGSGANQAAWLGRFGVAVRFAAKVGRTEAESWAAALARDGVEARLASDDDRPTGRLVTLLDPDGERSFLTDRGANDTLDREDLPDALFDGIALLHVSAYALFAPRPRRAVLDLMDRAHRRGIAVSLDPASVSVLAHLGAAAFLAMTRGASICFPNEAEAAVLAGSDDETAQRDLLARHYGTVVIKRGRRGAEIVGPGGRLLHRQAAPAIVAVDSTGAGDAFAAAYLAAHLAAAPSATCLARAVEAGSAATLIMGGRPPARMEPGATAGPARP